MLNKAMDSVVLVKGWKKSANWSFPRGKINKAEKDLDCAIREVYEETGFDIKAAGLAPVEEEAHSIEVTMREQNMRLYVFRDVPMNTHFEPRTRKEISKIQWYKLSELPTQKKKNHGQGEDLAKNAHKFYMVAPFLGPLRKWIAQQRKDQRKSLLTVSQTVNEVAPAAVEDLPVAEHQVGNPEEESHFDRLVAQLHTSHQNRAAALIAKADPELTEEEIKSVQLKKLLQVSQKPIQAEAEVSQTTFPMAGKQQDVTQRARGQPNINLPIVSKPLHVNSWPTAPHIPQTPLDQLLHTPMNPPESPKRYAPQTRHGLPPRAPVYPLPQERLLHREPGAFPFPHHQPHSRHQAILLPSQTFTHGNQVNQAAIARQRPIPANSAPELSAPYQRTGDPEFARSRQAMTNERPIVPPANKLPAPKLTSHSSSLLSLFKSQDALKSPTSSGLAEVPSVGREISKPSVDEQETSKPLPDHEILKSPGPMSPKELDAPIGFMGHRSFILDPRRDSTISVLSPSVEPPRRTSLAMPRSNQQESLLNLFRRPSEPQTQQISTPQAEQQSLAPPMTPVELSANPSPSHSRNTSEMDQQASNVSMANMNGRITIQKRPETPADLRKPPVSATMTRPMDLPQFDRIGRRESTASPSQNKPSPALERVVPVTILARPPSSHKPNGSPKRTPQVPVNTGSPLRAQPHKNRETHKASHKHPHPADKRHQLPPLTKPFQPQILQRKPQVPFSVAILQPPPPPIAIPPKRESPVSVQPSPFDTAHRNSLLSILSKPSTTQSPISPLTVSPLTEKTAGKDAIADSTMDEGQRSSVGSINSAIESGNRVGARGSGWQTPKSTGEDKLALLSFLDKVAKEGERK